MRPLVMVLAMLCAPPALAQAVIDPGMTRDQVVERLGKPVGERSVGEHTYLFYRNGCERRCGMHDVVTLANGAVVDALFRSASRRYTGESSSPPGRAPVNSAAPGSADGGGGQGASAGGGGVITGGPPKRPAGGARPAVEPAVRGSSAGTIVPTGGDSAASPRPADSAARSPRPPMAAGGQPAAGYRTDTVPGPGAPLRAGSGNRGARPAPNYKPNPADSVRNANAQRQPPDSVRPPKI